MIDALTRRGVDSNEWGWLTDEFSRLFDILPPSFVSNIYFPSDIVEKDDSFVFTAEVPGVDEKDITVAFENGRLTISYERQSQSQDKDKYHWREQYYGKYSRTFSVPRVDPENIKASLFNGILTVILGKKEQPTSTKKLIEVTKEKPE